MFSRQTALITEHPSNVSDWKAELLFRARAGPRKCFNWILDRLLDRHHDRRNGISSSDGQSSRALPFQSPEFSHYQAVSYSDVIQTMSLVPVSPVDVFLDYGSGMGRAVCIAALSPFQTVIGVELSPELCRIARQNVENIRNRLHCQDVQIIQANAVEYRPPINANVFFFFNPFGGNTMAQVLENIRVSVIEHRRTIRIIFCGTVASRRFQLEAAKHNWLKLESAVELRTGALALQYVTA